MAKILLNPADLTVKHYPERGVGGQQVGTSSSGVFIIHNPSGIGVMCNTERSQYKNKEKAIAMLEILLELESI